MEAMKLIGIVIVIIGFILKKDTIATVVIAGVATGLVSGMSFIEVLDILGKSFITQRVATVFVLTLRAVRLKGKSRGSDPQDEKYDDRKGDYALSGSARPGSRFFPAPQRAPAVCPPLNQPHGPRRGRGQIRLRG